MLLFTAHRPAKTANQPQAATFLISQLHLHDEFGHVLPQLSACQDAVWFMGFASDMESELCGILLLLYLSLSLSSASPSSPSPLHTLTRRHVPAEHVSRSPQQTPDLTCLQSTRTEEVNQPSRRCAQKDSSAARAPNAPRDCHPQVRQGSAALGQPRKCQIAFIAALFRHPIGQKPHEFQGVGDKTILKIWNHHFLLW